METGISCQQGHDICRRAARGRLFSCVTRLRGHRGDDAKRIALLFEDADDLGQGFDGFFMAFGAVHEDDGRVLYGGAVCLAVDVVDEVLGDRMVGRGVGGADVPVVFDVAVGFEGRAVGGGEMADDAARRAQDERAHAEDAVDDVVGLFHLGEEACVEG